MGGQISTTVSIIMVILFSIALIGFCVGFAVDNNAVMSIADDDDIATFYTNTKSNAATFSTDSNDTYASIIKTTVEPGSDMIQSSAPFTLTTKNFVGVFKNVLTLPFKKIFGGGENFGIFFTTFGAILGFILFLLVIKTWKGNP